MQINLAVDLRVFKSIRVVDELVEANVLVGGRVMCRYQSWGLLCVVRQLQSFPAPCCWYQAQMRIAPGDCHQPVTQGWMRTKKVEGGPGPEPCSCEEPQLFEGEALFWEEMHVIYCHDN